LLRGAVLLQRQDLSDAAVAVLARLWETGRRGGAARAESTADKALERDPKCADALTVLGNVEGVTEVQPQGEGIYRLSCTAQGDVRPRLARAVVQRGWELLELRTVSMSLEEIFLQLTADEGPSDEGASDESPADGGTGGASTDDEPEAPPDHATQAAEEEDDA
jgi:hypothetical protein